MRMGLPWAAAGPAAAIPMDRTKRALAHLVEPIGHPRMAILLGTLGGASGREGARLGDGGQTGTAVSGLGDQLRFARRHSAPRQGVTSPREARVRLNEAIGAFEAAGAAARAAGG